MKCFICVPGVCDETLCKDLINHFLNFTQKELQDLNEREAKIEIQFDSVDSNSEFYLHFVLSIDSHVEKEKAKRLLEKMFKSVRAAAIAHTPEGLSQVSILATFSYLNCSLIQGPKIINPDEEANIDRQAQNRLYMFPG